MKPWLRRLKWIYGSPNLKSVRENYDDLKILRLLKLVAHTGLAGLYYQEPREDRSDQSYTLV
jgi:hypothetical protein